MTEEENQAQPFDLGTALSRVGNIPTQKTPELETIEPQPLIPRSLSEGVSNRAGNLYDEFKRSRLSGQTAAGVGATLDPIAAIPGANAGLAADELRAMYHSRLGTRDLPQDYDLYKYYNAENAARERFAHENPETAQTMEALSEASLSHPSGMGAIPRNAESADENARSFVKENAPSSNQLNSIFTTAPQPTPTPRNIDALGYYSHALEAAKALPQAKGTSEQMLAQLKKAGVKDAELQATGVPQLFQGKPSVTRDELVQHLEQNRVGLNEVQRDAPNVNSYGEPISDTARIDRAKWQQLSLDPQNPTYRETVLHLPENTHEVFDATTGQSISAHPSQEEAQARVGELLRRDPAKYRDVDSGPIAQKPVPFRSGHFSEPNITGHLMTSMVEDNAGRKVFNVDQIQSDWGQKLRERGVRDEAKVADLQTKASDAYQTWMRSVPTNDLNREASERGRRAKAEYDRLAAELRTAEQAPGGHPLVNTTDQWTNTTLRHALRQAVESGADAISIPSGKTVLSYNPGDPHGMQEFYGKIVPKNLGNILKKIDTGAAKPEYHDQMITPRKGATGQGFTVFPLTDKIKKSVMEEGQPLFKRGGSVLRASGGSISDKTYALLHRIKRQGGGSTTSDANTPPQDERDIPTIDPAPLIPKSVSDMAPDLNRNVAGTSTYGGTLDPFQSGNPDWGQGMIAGAAAMVPASRLLAWQNPALAATIGQKAEAVNDATSLYALPAGNLIDRAYKWRDQLPALREGLSRMWNEGPMSSAEHEQIMYEEARKDKLDEYEKDPDGILNEAKEYMRWKPERGVENLRRDEYLRKLPMSLYDKAIQALVAEQGQSAFKTGTTSYGGRDEYVPDVIDNEAAPTPQEAKIPDRLRPGGWKTQIVPAQARGGALSDKTSQLLAKLKKRA